MFFAILLILFGFFLSFTLYFNFLDKTIKEKYNISSPFSKEMFCYIKFSLQTKEKTNEEIYGKEKHKIYFKSKFKAFLSFKFAFIWHIIINILVIMLGIGASFLLKIFWFDFFYFQENFSWNILSSIYFIGIFFLFILLVYLVLSSIKEIFSQNLFKSIDYTEKGIYLIKVSSSRGVTANSKYPLTKKVFYEYSEVDNFEVNYNSIDIVIKTVGIFNINFYSKFKIYLPRPGIEEINRILKNKIYKNNL
jgi:hypothetical protein